MTAQYFATINNTQRFLARLVFAHKHHVQNRSHQREERHCEKNRIRSEITGHPKLEVFGFRRRHVVAEVDLIQLASVNAHWWWWE